MNLKRNVIAVLIHNYSRDASASLAAASIPVPFSLFHGSRMSYDSITMLWTNALAGAALRRPLGTTKRFVLGGRRNGAPT